MSVPYRPAGQPPYDYHQESPNPGPEPGAEQPEAAYTCPECQAELGDIKHRRKHAYTHYGNGDIPNFPTTRLARERYAELVGEPVRGN